MSKCVGCNEIKSVGVQEDDEWICEDCDGPECGCCGDKTLNQGCGKMVNRGCCSDGDCNQDPPIEALCGECGTWDEEDEVWRCPDCQEEHENEKWEDDALVLELNHGNCENDGRHPKTNDEDWALFLESFIRPLSYSEDKYRRLEKRLQERAEWEEDWEEVYNSTDETNGEARDYCEQPGKFYQTYGNGGGKNGWGGYWIRDGSSGVWSVAGDTFTYLKEASVEYRNQRSMSGVCAAIRVDVNPPEPDGDGSDDE